MEKMKSNADDYFLSLAEFLSISPTPFAGASDMHSGHAHSVKSAAFQRLIFGAKTYARKLAHKQGKADQWEKLTRTLQPFYQRALSLNAHERPMQPREALFARRQLIVDAQKLDETLDFDFQSVWRTTFVNHMQEL